FKPTFGFGAASVAAPSPSPRAVQVVAKGFAFTPTTLRAPAGRGFIITFANQDAGVPHNLSIYRDQSASDSLFKGAIVTGPKAVTYRMGSLAAGTYFFRCDVHPAQMKGTFVVTAGSG